MRQFSRYILLLSGVLTHDYLFMIASKLGALTQSHILCFSSFAELYAALLWNFAQVLHIVCDALFSFTFHKHHHDPWIGFHDCTVSHLVYCIFLLQVEFGTI